MSVKLRHWQEEFVAWYSLRRKQGYKGGYLAADVGTGKTIAALAAARKVGAKDLVILAPLSAHAAWIEDGKKMGMNLKVGEDIWTYEKFSRMHRIPVGDLLILDEAHRVKNPSAKITKRMLRHFLNKPKLLLSGTPQDRLWELYTQYKLVEPSVWEESWSSWVRKYFFLDSYFKPKDVIKEEYKDEIIRKIEPHTYRVSLDEVVEIPPVEEVVYNIGRSKAISKFARQYEKEILNPVTAFIADYAIAQGIDPETKTLFDTTKVDWVMDYLQDNPKTIVFSYFRAPVLLLRDLLGSKAYFILGDDKKDLDAAIKKADKPVIATYALKEGANLQKYHHLVYMSLPLSYRDFYQSRGRAHRSGQQSKVVLTKLIGEPKDRTVEDIVRRKMELNEYIRKFEI